MAKPRRGQLQPHKLIQMGSRVAQFRNVVMLLWWGVIWQIEETSAERVTHAAVIA